MAKNEYRYIIETLIGAEWARTSIATTKETGIETCRAAIWAGKEAALHGMDPGGPYRIRDLKTDCVLYRTDRDPAIQ